MSGDRKRTAYFLADLKTKEKDWVEVRDDAMQPEEISVGRWADVGAVKRSDAWMNFPAQGRDPRHAFDDPAARREFLIPSYKITTTATEKAELSATPEATIEPRYTTEKIPLFPLASTFAIDSTKHAQDTT